MAYVDARLEGRPAPRVSIDEMARDNVARIDVPLFATASQAGPGGRPHCPSSLDRRAGLLSPLRLIAATEPENGQHQRQR
jgi:hypothetical protein